MTGAGLGAVTLPREGSGATEATSSVHLVGAEDRASRNGSLVFVVFTYAYFLSQFFRHANAAIAGQVSSEFNLDAAQLGLMTSLFYWVFAAAQVPLGVALDRFRSQYVVGVLMLGSVAGSLLFARSESFFGLAVSRALIGLGMACVLMGGLKVFGETFSARRYPAASGMMMGIGAVGGVLAASPMAWFSEAYGWRAPFLVGAGLTVLCCFAVVSVRAVGAAASVATVKPVPVKQGLGMVFRDDRFWRIAPLNLFMTGALMAMQGLWAGPFLRDVLHLSQTEAGGYLTLLSLGVIAGYFTSGWLASRFGVGWATLVAAVVFAGAQAALVGLALYPIPWLVRVVYAVLGLAGGFQVLVLVRARSLFPASLTGRGLTAVNLFGIGGSALLQWLIGLVISFFPREADGSYPSLAYAAAFALTAAGSAAAAAWYATLAQDRCSPK